MAIMNWLVRGDCHGSFYWMNQQLNEYKPEETAIILLGDAGLNFYLNKTDERTKKEVEAKGYYLYCVRGNHECRPEHLPNINYMYDKNVNNFVMYEPNYPHIRYFKNYGIYQIHGYNCLVIGGAYSVDKWYRLAQFNMTEATNIPKKTGWFADECLSELEMKDLDRILDEAKYIRFDFVFSHTCPKKYQPVDMFLGFIDQSKVDNSMEVWMDKITEKIVVNSARCFGHYHADRIEKPHVEQYFNDIEKLDTIKERWERYDKTGELDWWLAKSPRFSEV
jgi:3-oxoacid CoA-transferase subunit A